MPSQLNEEQRDFIRREICIILEDLGTVAIRIREDEDGMGDLDDVEGCFATVAEKCKALEGFVSFAQLNAQAAA